MQFRPGGQDTRGKPASGLWHLPGCREQSGHVQKANMAAPERASRPVRAVASPAAGTTRGSRKWLLSAPVARSERLRSRRRALSPRAAPWEARLAPEDDIDTWASRTTCWSRQIVRKDRDAFTGAPLCVSERRTHAHDLDMHLQVQVSCSCNCEPRAMLTMSCIILSQLITNRYP